MPETGVVLELAEDVGPVEHGQLHIQDDGVRFIISGEAEAGIALVGHDAFTSSLVSEIQQYPGEFGVVLDDEDQAVVIQDRLSIVVEGSLRRRRGTAAAGGGGAFAGAGCGRCWGRAFGNDGGGGGLWGCVKREGQLEGKGAAFAFFALHGDGSAQRMGLLAAYREPQTRTAVLAFGGAVCLLKGLEDDVPLVLRNADAGICNGEVYTGGRFMGAGCSGAIGHAYVKADLAVLPGKLESIGKQV